MGDVESANTDDDQRAAWLECAYGSSNEIVLEQDKETREWVRRHFPKDPNEPVFPST